MYEPGNAYLEAKYAFAVQWDYDHSKYLDLYGWDANPWVWVYEAEQISKEEAYVLRR